MHKISTCLLLCSLIFSCADKEKERELETLISALEMQLDECQNGADKLVSKMRVSFEENDYGQVKSLFAQMKERHPESPLFEEANQLHSDILKTEEENKIKEEKRIAAEKEKKLTALNKLKKNFDDVSGITWYKNPYFTHYTNSNRTSIYMGDNGTSRWIILMMSYYGDSWIFFEKAYLSYEGNTKEIIFDRYKDKDTDNDGDVWEWIEVAVKESDLPFLREFALSSDAKMRLTGKYSKTRNLSENERKGILDVLNGYEALKNLSSQ